MRELLPWEVMYKIGSATLFLLIIFGLCYSCQNSERNLAHQRCRAMTETTEEYLGCTERVNQLFPYGAAE